MKGILGRKAGMTQVFLEDGKTLPVTVIEVKPNVVLQVKTQQNDSYDSIQLGYETKDAKKVNRPDLGHAKKANTDPVYFKKEIRNMKGYELGAVLNSTDIFEDGDIVDIIGTSKGKGFAGSIKRHNYTRGPMSHGSKYHRGTGSMGDIRGVVKKSKKLPGHMGHEKVTVQNIQIVKIDTENNVILVKGSIPGANKGFVIIKNAELKPDTNKKVTLVNIHLEQQKLHLLEDGKKVGAELNTSMSLDEMKNTIETATVKHDLEIKEKLARHEEAKNLKIDVIGKTEEQIQESIDKTKELESKKEASSEPKKDDEGK